MSNAMTVSVVLPKCHFGEDEWKNAEKALGYADEAIEDGADAIFFPEGYPGPATGPLNQEKLDFEPLDALRDKAEKNNVWISASDVEPNPDNEETHFLTQKLISPDGEIAARYLRLQPDTPPLNSYLYDGKAHFEPGDESVVVDIDHAQLGMCICSELWVPEIPRMLMLKGAEVVFAPVHGFHSPTKYDAEQMAETWKCVARSRAAENTSFVITTQNYYDTDADSEDKVIAGALIASPEEVVATRKKPGVMTAELDMERLSFLRSRNFDEDNLSHPQETSIGEYDKLGCRPGQIWERMPELFKPLTKESKYSFNYEYYEDNIGKWKDDYEQKIYKDGEYETIMKNYNELEFVEKLEEENNPAASDD